MNPGLSVSYRNPASATARHMLRMDGAWGLVLLIILLSPLVNAAPGDFDAAFGAGGQLPTPYASGTAWSMLPDGRFLAYEQQTGPANPLRIHVRRMLANGLADATWGTAGEAAIDLTPLTATRGGSTCNRASMGSLVSVADGTTVGSVDFTCTSSTASSNVHVAFKLRPNGSMDATFGNGGLVEIIQSGGVTFVVAYVVGVQADGRMLIRLDWFDDFGTYPVGLRRLQADGTPEQDIAIPDLAFSASIVRARSDGRIVIAGTDGSALLNADGTLDRSYGDAGSVSFAAESALGAAILAAGQVAGTPAILRIDSAIVGADGAITLAMLGGRGTAGRPLVARLTANGRLDNAFGNGGVAQLDSRGAPWTGRTLDEWESLQLATAPTGELTLLGGVSFSTATAYFDQFRFLWRLTSDGQPPGISALRGVQVISETLLGSWIPAPAWLIGAQPGHDVLLGGYASIVRLSGTTGASAGMLTLGSGIADEGAALRIPVMRVAGSSGPVSLSYATSPMPIFAAATPGSDYVATTGRLDWADGETGVKYISVSIQSDLLTEPDERFAIDISGITGGAPLIGDTTRISVVIPANSAPGTPTAPTPTTPPTTTPISSGNGGGGAIGLFELAVAWCLSLPLLGRRMRRSSPGGPA